MSSTRENLKRASARIVASIVLAGTVLGGAGAAFADSGAISSIPAAGTTFACQSGTYTATAGSIKLVTQMGTSASGNFHITGTATADGVVLKDTSGASYRLVGASWFDTHVNAVTGAETVGSTDDFKILSQGGGTVARIQEKLHIDSQGQVSLDKSNCLAPF